MAVVESVGGDDLGAKAESTRRNCEGGDGAVSNSHPFEDLDAQQQQQPPPPPPPPPPPQQQQVGLGHLGASVDQGFQRQGAGSFPVLRPHLDQSASAAAFHTKVQQQQLEKNGVGQPEAAAGQQTNGEGFRRDMRDLVELLSKLNPMAEEFVPPPHVSHHGSAAAAAFGGGYPNGFFEFHNQAINGNGSRRKKNMFNQGKRINNRTTMAQREEIIRRTVYVSDIDQQVSEEQLAALFINCGQVVDCRICGDPNSVLRFAFIEFTDEAGARAALNLAGTVLGFYPVRVLPSKTAIAPVNPTFLPRSEDEREMCARTIYCTNIDKRVTQADVKLFFETVCGEVYRLRLLGDFHHATRIAFVEFVLAESAIAALNCSGVVLGTLPIRVSPSKTPVRPRQPRQPMH